MPRHKDKLSVFYAFVGEQSASGGASLTPAEALELWEIQNPAEDEPAATVAALREALNDMRAGDTGVPARDFLAEVRRKCCLPTRP
jgi:hypothetical protein